MTYNELKEYMQAFRLGNIGRLEMACAIALWQLDTYGEIA